MWQKMAKDTNNLADDARKLTVILIRLHQDYPLFFADVAPDDPDMDMNKSFKTYDELDRIIIQLEQKANDKHKCY